MLDVKFTNTGTPIVRLHKPTARKMQEVAQLLRGANNLLHPEALACAGTIDEILARHDGETDRDSSDTEGEKEECCGSHDACEVPERECSERKTFAEIFG